MPKRAKFAVVVVEVFCPYCGESFETAEGSLLWPVAEMAEVLEMACLRCNKYVRVELPRKIPI